VTESEAIAAVHDQRERLALDEEMHLASAEKAIVEFLADRSRPGPIAHRIAWIVTFSSAWGFAQVHVDDASGEILHVKRSAR